MTIRVRLIAAFAAVALLLGLPLGYGVNRLRAVRSIAVTLRDSHAEAYAALGGLRAALAEYDRHARSYVIVPDHEFRSGMRQALAGARAQETLLEGAGFGDIAAPTRAWLDSLAATTVTLETLVEGGRSDAATALMRSAVGPAVSGVQVTLDPVERAVNRSSADEAALARDISTTATVMATSGALLALLVAAGIAWWTTWAITGPLRSLRRSMASVAGGGTRLEERLPYTRNDEIGDLSRSFRTMTEQLADLERIRGEFLNVVSHDLKAPLGLINSYAELIEEDAPADLDVGSRRLLASIRENVRQLTERVNRLLSLGRLEARAYPVHPEPVPVQPFFHGVRRAFEPQARRQEVAFVFTIERTAPTFVLADAECIHHEVIDNLLSNAFKFTPKGGCVDVRVWGQEQPPRWLHFSVTDTGPGIPEEDLPHIFSKYYQVGRRASVGGVGLGLTIAYEVVQAHGGTIDATRPGDAGTRFHVMLPAPVPERSQSPAVTSAPSRRWRTRAPAPDARRGDGRTPQPG